MKDIFLLFCCSLFRVPGGQRENCQLRPSFVKAIRPVDSINFEYRKKNSRGGAEAQRNSPRTPRLRVKKYIP